MKIVDNSFKKCGGVYIIRNNITKKYYIGESLNIRERMSFHRNRRDCQIIHKSISKHGIENFEVYVEYLSGFKKKDLLDLEEQLIIRFGSLIPNGYNVSPRGNDSNGYKHTKEAIAKIKNSCIDNPKRKHSLETKNKMSILKKGKPGHPVSEETKAKISKSHMGKTRPPRSKEWRDKQSLSHIGKPSPLKGRSLTEEHKQKISKAGKGRKDPVEVIEKRRQSILLAKHNYKECKVSLESI